MTLSSLKFIILVAISISGCAFTSPQIFGDINIVIDTPAYYSVGISNTSPMILGHVSQTQYKQTSIPNGSQIVGNYFNDGNNRRIQWTRINLAGGRESIGNLNLAYTPCKVKDTFEPGQSVAGYWGKSNHNEQFNYLV